MGQETKPAPVMLIMAAICHDEAALDWSRDWAISAFGDLLCESSAFAFVETDYYKATMGPSLTKTFFAFQQLVSPDCLAAVKRTSNKVEVMYASQTQTGVVRPLNLDPGYLSESKLVLATTKDHAHRIHLNNGIYAEVTLRYRGREWQPWEWTYPDYRREDYHEFFTKCRNALRSQRLEQFSTGKFA